MIDAIVCKQCTQSRNTAIVVANGWTVDNQVDFICESCYQVGKDSFLSRRNEKQRLGMISDMISHASRFRTPVTNESFVLPDEILQGKLYLGSRHASGNLERLAELNIGQILVCCSSLPAYFVDISMSMRYLRLPVSDSVDQDLSYGFESAVAFINEGYEVHHKATLVHCQEGISRSSSIVIAYLILHEKMSYGQAYAHVSARRPVVSPNKHFKAQLRALSPAGSSSDVEAKDST